MPPRIIKGAQVGLEFIASESGVGALLLSLIAVAMLLANSTLSGTYFAVFSKPILGEHLTLGLFIMDILMPIAFLHIGTEIKREMVAPTGELRGNRALLPVIAAIGGMLVPALIYTTLNRHNPAALAGWAVPCATDIAITVAVLGVFSNRVPAALKMFILAIAVADDLMGIAVIAMFYTASLNINMLAAAAVVSMVMLAVKFGLKYRGIFVVWPTLVLGLLLWWVTLQSGIHPTIAGVITAFMLPYNTPDDVVHVPLLKVEHALNGWVSYLIFPLFAFANAGVSFAGMGAETFSSTITIGVATALLVGKPVGIVVATFAAIWGLNKLGLCTSLPAGINLKSLYAGGQLAAIGFTVSMFIGLLAFSDAGLIAQAKLGVIIGSGLAIVVGSAAIMWFLPKLNTAAPLSMASAAE